MSKRVRDEENGGEQASSPSKWKVPTNDKPPGWVASNGGEQKDTTASTQQFHSVMQDVQKSKVWTDLQKRCAANPKIVHDLTTNTSLYGGASYASIFGDMTHAIATAEKTTVSTVESSLANAANSLMDRVVTSVEDAIHKVEAVLHPTPVLASGLSTVGLFAHTPYHELDPLAKKSEQGSAALLASKDGHYSWNETTQSPVYPLLPSAEYYSALDIFGARALKATIAEATLRLIPDPNCRAPVDEKNGHPIIVLDDTPCTIGALLPESWHSDTSFALQRFQGVNPGQLKQESDSYFCVDYSTLQKYDLAHKAGTTFGVKCILRIQDGKLEPRCIFSGEFVANQGDGWKWNYAKLLFGCAEFTHHEIINHLTWCHLMTEVFIMATMQTWRGSDHPVYRLLVPHFSRTLAVNSIARELLVPWIKQHMTILDPNAIDQLIKDQIRTFDPDSMHFEKNLIQRRFFINNLPPGYFYAQDGLRIWESLHGFVQNVLEEEGKIDFLSVLAWCKAIQNHVSNFPTITKVEQLTDAVTSIIFNASIQHSAVNDPQYFFLGYAPNAICKLMKPIPSSNTTTTSWTDADWKQYYFDSLPSKQTMSLQKDLVSILALGVPEKSSLSLSLDDYETRFSASCVDSLRNVLANINHDIQQRSEYTWLSPFTATRSVIR